MNHLIVTHSPAQSDFRSDGPRAFFAYADLGLSEATQGAFSAHRAKALLPVHAGEGTGPHVHEAEFQLIFVLRGRALLNYQGRGMTELVAGDLVYQPKNLHHDVVEVSVDYEHLEISMPAKYETRAVPAV